MTSAVDKMKGMGNQAAGAVKEGVGKAVGNEKLQGEGAMQKAKGDLQEAKGNAKDAVKKVIDGA